MNNKRKKKIMKKMRRGKNNMDENEELLGNGEIERNIDDFKIEEGE